MDQAWVMQQVQQWPTRWFGLETSEDKDIWCYIIAASGHLEDLAASFLWEYDARPGELEQYKERANLGVLSARPSALRGPTV